MYKNHKRQFGLPPAQCQLAFTGAVGHSDFTYNNLQKATLLAPQGYECGPCVAKGCYRQDIHAIIIQSTPEHI